MNTDNINNKPLFHSWSFSKINYQLFLIGLFVIISGYFIMALGETESFWSVKFAPIVLIVGYCVLIPASILIKAKNSQ